MNRLRALLVLLLALGAAGVLVRVEPAGRGAVWRDPLGWVDAHGATRFAVEIARLAALVGSAYLVALCAHAAARDVLPLRTATLPAPTVVRRALGLALAGSIAVPAGAIAQSSPTTDAPVLVLVEPAPTTTTQEDVRPTMEQVDVAPTVPPPPPTTTVAAVTTWKVHTGESFWTIAEQVVGTQDDARVASYWRTLVDANRDRLAVPGNPDLIFPGQELVLPPA